MYNLSKNVLLYVGITILFLGLAIQPSITTIHLKNNYYTTIEEKQPVLKQELSYNIDDDLYYQSNNQYKLQSYSLLKNPEKDNKSIFNSREIIIKFKQETDINIKITTNNIVKTGISTIDTLNEKHNVISAKKLFKKLYKPYSSNIYKFVFSDDIDIYRTIQEYLLDSNVEYAEPNYKHYISPIQVSSKNEYQGLKSTIFHTISSGEIPNDPFFDEQWALNRSNDCDIDAPEAWQIEKGKDSVIVAVVDSGIDLTHEDLVDNIWLNIDEIPDNNIDDDGNGYIDDTRGWDFVNNDNKPIDDYGHGTYCSGIIAASTNNSIGMAGVSWYSKIMPLKVINSEGAVYEYDIVDCIYYAVDNGADIISMSWGWYTKSKIIYDCMKYAYDYDVVLVAAAGNSDRDYKAYPAAYDQVIAVGATNQTDKRARDWSWGSNFGNWIDVSAPGTGILTTDRGNKYVKIKGTSAACPHVAGLAALLLSKHEQCPCPIQMVRSVICFTADEIETDEYIGTGRINAYNALMQELFAVELEEITCWEDVKGTIEIKGTIWGESLQYYILELGIGDNPGSWTELLNSSIPQSGVLLSIDTTNLDEGLYSLRLKAKYSFGMFFEKKEIYVNNLADGSYDADIFVSNCFDSSTSGWDVTHFDKIQNGVDKAKIGDTVFVYDGIYNEDIYVNGLLKSSINLMGQNKNWTIIEGNIFLNFTKKVTVSRFNVRGGDGVLTSKSVFPSITTIGLVFTSQCSISDCNIVDLIPFSANVVIFASDNSFIKNNTFIRRYGDLRSTAILQQFTFKSEFSGNTIYGARGIGIALMAFTRSNIISNNNITDCNTGGILLSNTRNNLIYKNNIFKCDIIGIYLWPLAINNKIIANNITDINGLGIEADEGQFNNHIYYNNFIRNIGRNGWDIGINSWYKRTGLFQGKGNYWDDYTGNDSNNDGVGDEPYNIHPIKIVNKDRFPLMEPVDIDNVDILEFIDGSFFAVKNQSNNKQFLNSLFLNRFPILDRFLYQIGERSEYANKFV